MGANATGRSPPNDATKNNRTSFAVLPRYLSPRRAEDPSWEGLARGRTFRQYYILNRRRKPVLCHSNGPVPSEFPRHRRRQFGFPHGSALRGNFDPPTPPPPLTTTFCPETPSQRSFSVIGEPYTVYNIYDKNT